MNLIRFKLYRVTLENGDHWGVAKNMEELLPFFRTRVVAIRQEAENVLVVIDASKAGGL